MPARTIALISAGIFVLTAAVVVALWWPGTAGLSGEALVTARFDALRTGLSIGVGSGGIFALYLAWRRQHATEVGLVQKERDQDDVARAYELQRDVAEHTRLHAERVAAATEKDAADRRVTELYSKSVEQLGSDKPAVRLGGLYALERLAQQNVDQRTTVIKVMCAYLRMPYELPQPVARRPRDPHNEEVRQQVEVQRPRKEEREVRLAAQRIITEHLEPIAPDTSNPLSWGAYALDLRGAVLVDLDLSGRRVGSVRFDGATFVGSTRFSKTCFTQAAVFVDATFKGVTRFTETRFGGDARFPSTYFTRATSFGGAKFEARVEFHAAQFRGDPHLGQAEFMHPRKVNLTEVKIEFDLQDPSAKWVSVRPPYPSGWIELMDELVKQDRWRVVTLGRASASPESVDDTADQTNRRGN
ncbi:pentapeptide repeat-containing protein [Lentzea sp. NPDC051838]|uniref:pentapeptide repeat-containing protein n=1 Tax=Lentzea sp. NPDC051838 TaxID=3154849 RepID=UPI003427AF78